VLYYNIAHTAGGAIGNSGNGNWKQKMGMENRNDQTLM